MQLQKIIKTHWFLILMVFAIFLAALIPDYGKDNGVLKLEVLTKWGVALIFFLQGVSLSSKAIQDGMLNWRLHLFIQTITFIVYPILWVIFHPIFLGLMPAALAFGFCFLFALPSTVSSSVAMTSVGLGNVPGAVFNASLSSLLGVFLTPLLVQLFIGTGGSELDLWPTIRSISLLLLLPLVLGQMLRSLLLKFFNQHKSILGQIDKIIILFIVFNAFSNSVVAGIWHTFKLSDLMLTCIFCFITLLSMVRFITFLAHKVGFNHQDEVAAVFCASKKTLIAGIPMAKAIFGADPRLGMLLLPIMIYHPIQIFYCALLAQRYRKKALKLDENNALL